MKMLKIILLVMISVAIALAGAEGVSRFLFPIHYGQKYFMTDGTTPAQPLQDTVTLTPDLQYRQIAQEFDKPTTHTSRGFRGPAKGFMDPVQPDVIFIGDSMTYGIGLADSETIPFQFCQTLKLRCINLGRPGASTVTAIKVLEHYLTAYQLRPVKVNLMMNVMTASLFGGNDVLDNLQDAPPIPAQTDTPAHLTSQPPSTSWTQTILSYRTQMLEMSNLVRVTYYVLAPWLRATFNPAFQKDQLAQGLSITKSELVRLDALARKYGFEYTIYLVHPLQDLTRGTYAKTLEDIVRIAPQNRVVSTAEALMSEGKPSEYYYPLDGHVRPSGAEKIAAFMAGR
jgi:hypothetical protein